MKRHRTLVRVSAFVALAAVAGAAGWFAAIAPQRAHAGTLGTQISAAQAQLVALEAAKDGTPGASATQLYQLARAMPANDDLPGILLALARLSQRADLQLVSVHPSPRVTLADGSAALPLSVVVAGRYGAVTALLHALHTQVRRGRSGVVAAGRLFVADGASLLLGQGDDVTATLQLNAFDYGAPPATTSVAGPAATATGATTTTPAPPSGAQAAGSTG